MEVDRISFAPRLLEMLEDLVKSSFVAIDFEFSGIVTKSPHAAGKQTVQERYRETKEAAERYQILQIGLTFAIYDDDRHRYTLKPYNMNLNPLLDEKLDVERIFSFQSGAVEFLLRHGFSFDAPFRNGVPYLSREEAMTAKQLAYNRLSRKNIEDIHIGAEDVEATAFLEGLRKLLDAGRTEGYDEMEIFSRFDVCPPCSVNGGTVASESDATAERRPGLTRFEKRLVHQLVRAEYSDLVTISGYESIRIIPLDEEREAELLCKRKHGVKEQINRQTGFRWIVEALLGNPPGRIDARSFAYDPYTGAARYVDIRALQSRFDQVCGSIKLRRIPLVGHNMFTDLVYFYQTFIGSLPDTVEGFTAEVHRLFPTIIDTKYLATHNCGDINPASSLQEIEAKLQAQQRPTVDTHQDHAKYVTEEAFHEAGYDSYLTALVAIRLSAKLENEATYLEEAQASGDKQQASTGLAGALKSIVDTSVTLLAPSSHASPPASSLDTQQATRKQKQKQKRSRESKPGRFSTANLFERLGMMNIDDDRQSDSDEAHESGVDSTSWDAPPPKHVQEILPPMTEMPAFTSDFWHVYGNKLRMFGTREGLLDLSEGTEERRYRDEWKH